MKGVATTYVKKYCCSTAHFQRCLHALNVGHLKPHACFFCNWHHLVASISWCQHHTKFGIICYWQNRQRPFANKEVGHPLVGANTTKGLGSFVINWRNWQDYLQIIKLCLFETFWWHILHNSTTRTHGLPLEGNWKPCMQILMATHA